MEELEKQPTAAEADNVNEDLHDTSNSCDTPLPLESTGEPVSHEANTVDYARVAQEDLEELKSEFPELSDISDICELNNPLRYAALRDLGLSAREAYLATAKRAPRRDNRAHLSAIGTVSYAPQGTMSEAEMAAARELFSDISDAQIRKLYKKVTK